MGKGPVDEVLRRDAKKLRTRRDLERVALSLCAERGFDDVTIDEIAGGAAVSKRTFYRYYESKEDVLLGNFDLLLDQIAAADADGGGRDELLASIKTAILGFATKYEADREIVLTRGRMMRETPSLAARSLERQAHWEDRLAALVGHRLGVDADRDLRPRLVAATVVAALRVAILQWSREGGTGHLSDSVAEAFDLIDAGLGRI
jgi:AcrR family transcriptional regulator